jgi:hypothetical protein
LKEKPLLILILIYKHDLESEKGYERAFSDTEMRKRKDQVRKETGIDSKKSADVERQRAT